MVGPLLGSGIHSPSRARGLHAAVYLHQQPRGLVQPRYQAPFVTSYSEITIVNMYLALRGGSFTDGIECCKITIVKMYLALCGGSFTDGIECCKIAIVKMYLALCGGSFTDGIECCKITKILAKKS